MIKAKILIAAHNSVDAKIIKQGLYNKCTNDILLITDLKAEYRAALADFQPDIIIYYYDSRSKDNTLLLRLRQQLAANVPFIFVTKRITLEKAIVLVKNGADDIVLTKKLHTLAEKVNVALEGKNSDVNQQIQKNFSQKCGFKIMADLSSDLIFLLDKNGSFTYINKTTESAMGYNSTELIGRNINDFSAVQEQEFSTHLSVERQPGNPLPPHEKKIRHKNGSIITLFWSCIWDKDSQINYCRASFIKAEKYSEKAFEIQQRRFYNLFLQAPSCMGILKGENHVYEMANDLYQKLIDRKDIIGKTVKEVLPELATQGIFEILDSVYNTGKSYSANEMLISLNRYGNGKLIDTYLNFIFQAHRDINNNIDGILFFANDVTEQVVSRKKIEESEKMYKKLIHKLPVPTYSCDAKGRIMLYNKAAAVLWGREPQTGTELWDDSWRNASDLHPYSNADLTNEWLERETSVNRKIIIERPNGEKRNVLPYPVPFHDAQGAISGAVIVLLDITEMKMIQKDLQKSEKKYRYLFDNNPMPMWVIDLSSYKFLDVNRMAILQYGYSREEFLSMSALDIRPANDRDHFIRSSDKSKINESNYNRGKWHHLKKNGTVIPVEIVAHNIKYEGNAARLILSSDITDQRKAETDLEKRNKDLLKANSELDKFVYSVSHDLRSPLTSILGLLAFIESESTEPDTIKHAEMIRTSVNRLDEFIKNILSYSRNSRTGVIVQEIALHETVTDIVGSLQRMKEATGIRYEINIKQGQPFYTDRIRLNTILENLISNAIKYHKKEASERYIKVEGYSDNENLHLTVMDNGIGIEAAYHQKIYEMFFRLSSKKEGSGIGLYIVKEAIEKLQGSIEIESEEGTGTTFTITLKNFKS